MSVNTIAESGLVRIYRDLTAGDIDVEKAMLEIRGSGLDATLLDGHMNSFRASDGTGAVAERLVVRGDGVNTVVADGGAVATTTDILGMIIQGGENSPDLRIATAGSIVDGFGGTLVKHSVYFLGTAGAISLTPDTVEVIVGIAVSDSKLLLAPCCVSRVGGYSLNYCFSSALFVCDDGATYGIQGTTPDCIPALCFDPSVLQNWYCGFETPNEMDTTQDSQLVLFFYPTAAPANPVQIQFTMRHAAAGQNIFTNPSTFTPAAANPVPPGANTLFVVSTTIPGGQLTAATINRLNLQRQGADPADTFAGQIYLINAQIHYLLRSA